MRTGRSRWRHSGGMGTAEQKLPFRQRFAAQLAEKLLELITATSRNETAIRETIGAMEIAIEGSSRFPPKLWPSVFFKDTDLVFDDRLNGPRLIHWALELHDYLDASSSSTLAGR